MCAELDERFHPRVIRTVTCAFNASDETARKAGKAGRVARDGDQRQRHPLQV